MFIFVSDYVFVKLVSRMFGVLSWICVWCVFSFGFFGCVTLSFFWALILYFGILVICSLAFVVLVHLLCFAACFLGFLKLIDVPLHNVCGHDKLDILLLFHVN